MTEPDKRIAVVCKHCASDRVTRDAWAAWDVASQGWTLGAAYDYAYCHRCETETRLIDVELA